jgi:hypothetical protein
VTRTDAEPVTNQRQPEKGTSPMTKRKNITFKVWLEIERFNEKTGDSENLDAPGSSLASFESYEEAWDYAQRVTLLAEGINL